MPDNISLKKIGQRVSPEKKFLRKQWVKKKSCKLRIIIICYNLYISIRLCANKWLCAVTADVPIASGLIFWRVYITIMTFNILACLSLQNSFLEFSIAKLWQYCSLLPIAVFFSLKDLKTLNAWFCNWLAYKQGLSGLFFWKSKVS